MKEYKAENIINFVLAGHASSGKTSLAESFSFCSGAIRQKGSIQSGNTLSDYRKNVLQNDFGLFEINILAKDSTNWIIWGHQQGADVPAFSDQ